MKKIVFVLGLVMALSLVSVASAATIAEQIAALQAQLNALLAQQGGTAASNSSIPTITKTLTVGSRGTEVEALQQYLIDEGMLDYSGTLGYFGALTKAAVIEWQKANDVTPASGLFGPISRAKLAELATTTTGTTGTAGTGTTGITTPGVEGTLTVTANPTPSSGQTLREGDVKLPVLGLKLEAKLSDISVQRVKVMVGTTTTVYNKLFDKIYVLDGSTVLAESALNSTTVVKDGSSYYITLTGFNVIVPKNSSKVITIALDAKSSIDSTYNNNATYGLTIPKDAVRGVDGAGLTQTGPADALSIRTVTIGSEAIADSASMVLSKNNTYSPIDTAIVAADGSSNDEKDKVTFLSFDVRAKKDALTITDLAASITKTGTGTATATVAYLMDGDTTLGSATVNTTTGAITFSDIDYTVPADTTKTLTLKADIRSANATAAILTGAVSGSGLTVENSTGSSIVPTGSATGGAITLKSAGTEFVLVSKSATGSTITNTNGVSTTTVAATFKVKVTANGATVLVGGEASTSPMFASTTNYLVAYQGDTATALTPTFLTISCDDLTASSNTWSIADGSSATFTVTANYSSRSSAGAAQLSGGAAVGIAGITTINGGTSVRETFMAGQTAWRTSPTVTIVN